MKKTTMSIALVALVVAIAVANIIFISSIYRSNRMLEEELAEWTGEQQDGITAFWKAQVKDARATYNGSFDVYARGFLSQCDKSVSEKFPSAKRVGFGRALYDEGPFLWYAWIDGTGENESLRFYVSVRPRSDDLWALDPEYTVWRWDNNPPDGRLCWIAWNSEGAKIDEAIRLLEEPGFFSDFRPFVVLDH